MKLYDIDLPTRSYQMFFEQAILSAERQDIQDERPSFEILPSLRALGATFSIKTACDTILETFRMTNEERNFLQSMLNVESVPEDLSGYVKREPITAYLVCVTCHCYHQTSTRSNYKQPFI
jgi:hypothetical protein